MNNIFKLGGSYSLYDVHGKYILTMYLISTTDKQAVFKPERTSKRVGLTDSNMFKLEGRAVDLLVPFTDLVNR